MRNHLRISAFMALAFLAGAAGAAPRDDEMKRLAASSGCTLCHAAWQPKTGESAAPPAPAWNEIASRYRGQKGMEDKLVATVVRGTTAAGRHWAGEASVTTMPSNRIEISDKDARALIRWILRQ